MRVNDMYPGKYLKSDDAKAAPIIATIADVQQELVGQGQDQKEKWVLHLEGQRPLVLNRTNAEALEEAFGDSDDWPGHKVKIHCARVDFGGKKVDGLRVEPIVTKPKNVTKLEDDLNDDVPSF
jgi:hypothetical protein